MIKKHFFTIFVILLFNPCLAATPDMVDITPQELKDIFKCADVNAPFATYIRLNGYERPKIITSNHKIKNIKITILKGKGSLDVNTTSTKERTYEPNKDGIVFFILYPLENQPFDYVLGINRDKTKRFMQITYSTYANESSSKIYDETIRKYLENEMRCVELKRSAKRELIQKDRFNNVIRKDITYEKYIGNYYVLLDSKQKEKQKKNYQNVLSEAGKLNHSSELFGVCTDGVIAEEHSAEKCIYARYDRNQGYLLEIINIGPTGYLVTSFSGKSVKGAYFINKTISKYYSADGTLFNQSEFNKYIEGDK